MRSVTPAAAFSFATARAGAQSAAVMSALLRSKENPPNFPYTQANAVEKNRRLLGESISGSHGL